VGITSRAKRDRQVADCVGVEKKSL